MNLTIVDKIPSPKKEFSKEEKIQKVFERVKSIFLNDTEIEKLGEATKNVIYGIWLYSRQQYHKGSIYVYKELGVNPGKNPEDKKYTNPILEEIKKIAKIGQLTYFRQKDFFKKIKT